MGREIRKVPANWEHPKRLCPHYPKCPSGNCFHPMHDKNFEAAAQKWLRECAEWKPEDHDGDYFWEYDYPPDRDYCRPYRDDERVWFQVYETVSEGTPVTPAFATKEELIAYLAVNGDFWDQRRRREGTSRMNCSPWGIEAATNFVNSAWAPSFIGTVGQGIAEGKLVCPEAEKKA